MAITVKKLTEVFPDSSHKSPHHRACALANAGLDYLTACTFLVENHKLVGPLFNVILPTMHQTLELLTKAIAHKVDTNFNPMNYKHDITKIIQNYSFANSLLASMAADQKTLDFLEELNKAYFGVRYGECYLSMDYDDYLFYKFTSEALLDELSVLTHLKYLPRH